MKKWYAILVALVLVGSLVGCKSGVDLDKPVDGAAASQQSGANTSATGNSGVTSVDLGAANAAAGNAGPANTPKIIFFDFDSYQIRPEYSTVIEAHAKYLMANRQRNASLEGHTDARGGREYNLALGQRRAEAVRRALVLLGVADSQVEAVSYGKEKPAINGSDEEAYAQNRRVEIRYR